MAELAGRTAYKSEDRITEGSAKKFVESLMKLKHGAVLEHGTIYLTISDGLHAGAFPNDEGTEIVKFYEKNPYSKVNLKYVGMGVYYNYITTNLRVIFENDRLDDLQYLCEPTEYHEKRITAKFICSRSIAQEITRHRVFSFLMESQRYVGYNKDKFGGEITIIVPEWIKARINDIASYNNNDDLAQIPYSKAIMDKRMEEDMSIITWRSAQDISENYYMRLTELGCKSEEARGVLTNDCKTELIMTGFVSDWKHFFDLRSRGTTGKPHPDIKILADNLLFQFINKGYVN
jgi:thymidylate synthase (FAD)